MSEKPEQAKTQRFSKSGKPWRSSWDNVTPIKPGQCLNPNGARTHVKQTLARHMDECLSERMTVTVDGQEVSMTKLQVMARWLVRMALEALLGNIRDAKMIPIHKVALDHVLSRCDPLRVTVESRRIEIQITGKASESFATTLKARVDETGALEPGDILEALRNTPIETMKEIEHGTE